MAAYATYLRDEGHEVIWDEEKIEYGKRIISKTSNRPGIYIDEYVPPGDLWDKYSRVIVKWDDCTEKSIVDCDSFCLAHQKTDKIIKDDFQIDVPFEKLPYPDRVFTDAKNKCWQSYGNYKFHPATHMMASNLCWWGKCTFCVDTLKLQQGEKRGLRTVEHVIEEIDDLIRLGFREVFDDSGTFPIGTWLDDFCRRMLQKNRKNKIIWGCNMKPIAEKVVPFKLMKEAGCRFMLVGVESANQATIDKIHKGQESNKVIENMKAMNDAGLEVHLTSMFGYEWETHEDAMRTVHLIHYLLKKGYVKTAQASVYSPPRTTPNPNSHGHKYIPMIYDAYRSPEFIYRKICDLKRWEDFTYLLRGARLVVEEKLRKAFR